MSRFYIKTQETVSIISGDKMFLDDGYLYIYKGEELYGMFRHDSIIDAHRTDREGT